MLIQRGLLWFFVSAPLWVACQSSFDFYYDVEEKTITTVGGTCGEWQVPSDPGRHPKLVRASCISGLDCSGGAWSIIKQPSDLSGRRVHTCMPVDAVACTAEGKCRVDGFTCRIGYMVSAGGRCELACRTHQDCPDENQVCYSGQCEFFACPLPGEDVGSGYPGCPQGSQCSFGLCKTGGG